MDSISGSSLAFSRKKPSRREEVKIRENRGKMSHHSLLDLAARYFPSIVYFSICVMWITCLMFCLLVAMNIYGS